MKKHTSVFILMTGLLISTTTLATNGYFAHGYGSKSKALAGTGVALALDALSPATNPAHTALVDDRFDLNLAIFSPSPRGYTAGAPAGGFPLAPVSSESDSNYFLIPAMAYRRKIDDHSAWGVAMYGNGGMNTNYPPNAGGGPGVFGAGQAGVNLEQLFINASYARKLSDKSAWGVSFILAQQRFDAVGLAGFAGLSSDGNAVTNNGVSTSVGYGLKLGWTGEVTDGLSLGVSYQTELQMGEFDEYRGLFAEQGGFNIPSTWTVGLAWTANNWSKVTLDIQNIAYGDIASIANPLLSPNQLGTDNGPGFGWEDMTIVKLGYQWQLSPEWAWRVGFSMGDQPIPEKEALFNILAPGIMEQHLTFGFTKTMSKTMEFNFALMHAPKNTVSGTNGMSGGQTVELEMTQTELELGLSWHF